jgi:hypothetical protein
MAPYRIYERRVKGGVGKPTPDEQFRSYLDRLMKMIPGEVVALYLVGAGIIPREESRWWLVVWSVVCLVGLFALRIYGTTDRRESKGPQWLNVFMSAGAFVIWIYSLGGPFVAFGLYKPFLGSLLVLTWTFFIPLTYKGD